MYKARQRARVLVYVDKLDGTPVVSSFWTGGSFKSIMEAARKANPGHKVSGISWGWYTV